MTITTMNRAFGTMFIYIRSEIIRAVLIITTLLLAVSTNPLQAEENIKIGVIVPMTGPLAAKGNEVLTGIETAVEHLNENRKSDAPKLIIKTADSACDAAMAMTAAQKMVEQSGTMALVEYPCGGSAAAISQAMANRNRLHIVYLDKVSAVKQVLTATGDLKAGDDVTMKVIADAFSQKSLTVSERAVGGFIAVEVVGKALAAGVGSDADKLSSWIASKRINTDAGIISFAPKSSNSSTNPKTIALSLWSAKKNCPKCPKAGACPQSIIAMIAAKKTCN